MSYDQQSAVFARIPVQFVALDLPVCPKRFGQANAHGTCSATGDYCYNTWVTCAKKADYVQSTGRLLFSEKDVLGYDVGQDTFSLVNNISYDAMQLTPGKGLGVRGVCNIKMHDAPWPDVQLDPYYVERGNVAQGETDGLGTFWGKLKARQKYFFGKFLTVFDGFVDENGQVNLNDCRQRVFVIESIDGPARNDFVTIKAKDVLKLADNDRAQCPKPTNLRLSAAISAADTTLSVALWGNGTSASVLDELENQNTGYIRIASEVLAYTLASTTGETAVLNVTRAQYNTAAKDAKVDDAVQYCKRITNKKAFEIFYDLLVNYADIPAAFIDYTEWQTYGDSYIQGVYSTLITEPTGVNKLIAELTEQSASFIWWSDFEQKIHLKALNVLPPDLPILTDDEHFLAGDNSGVEAGEAIDEQQSRYVVYFDLIDPTKKLDEASNYAQRYIDADVQVESDRERGAAKIRTIYSRWVDNGALGRVQQFTESALKRYRDAPATLKFELDASVQLNVGDYFIAKTRVLQSTSGFPALVNMQVLEKKPVHNKARNQFKASQIAYLAAAPQDYIIQITADDFNIVLWDLFLANYGAGINLTGKTVTFNVAQGVTIGSVDITQAALRIGGFPQCNVVFNNNGVVVGKGGMGDSKTMTYEGYIGNDANGNWLFGTSANYENNLSGGISLVLDNAVVNLLLNNNAGAIIGGGGGGVSFAIDKGNVDQTATTKAGGGGAGYGIAGVTYYTHDNHPLTLSSAGTNIAGGLGSNDGHASHIRGGKGGDIGFAGANGQIYVDGGGNNQTFTGNITGGQAGAAITTQGTAGVLTINNNGIIRGHGNVINAQTLTYNGNAVENT